MSGIPKITVELLAERLYEGLKKDYIDLGVASQIIENPIDQYFGSLCTIGEKSIINDFSEQFNKGCRDIGVSIEVMGTIDSFKTFLKYFKTDDYFKEKGITGTLEIKKGISINPKSSIKTVLENIVKVYNELDSHISLLKFDRTLSYEPSFLNDAL